MRGEKAGLPHQLKKLYHQMPFQTHTWCLPILAHVALLLAAGTKFHQTKRKEQVHDQ